MMKKLLVLVLLSISYSFSNAQSFDAMGASTLIQKNLQAVGLDDTEVKNSIISNTYFNRLPGTHLVYLQQTFLGLPVYNQLMNLVFKKNNLVAKTGAFIAGIDKKATTKSSVPTVSAISAATTAMASKGTF